MSAYIVCDATIDVILDTLKAAVSHIPHPSRLYWRGEDGQPRFFGQNDARDLEKMNELGRLLFAQNARSVGERYREGQSPAALLYTYNPTRKQFNLRPSNSQYDSTLKGASITAEAAWKNISCYEYQSCETDDWGDTEAYRFCVALKDRIGDIALKSDVAPWGWTDSNLGRKELTLL